jgi:hypothetical protein
MKRWRTWMIVDKKKKRTFSCKFFSKEVNFLRKFFATLWNFLREYKGGGVKITSFLTGFLFLDFFTAGVVLPFIFLGGVFLVRLAFHRVAPAAQPPVV